MFSLADVMKFFPHEFSGLGGGGFAFPRIAAGPFNG
jgi:hypothetical protein